MKLLRKLRNHILKDILGRINDLEVGVRVLVDSPSYKHEEGAGFNGQKGRKQIFSDLVSRYRFSTLIETGTYLGDTAGYMATTTGLPVLTCERNPSLYALARARLKEIPGISLYNMDSREFLHELSRKPGITREECFIYLDAHWGRDVPLKEEISIVSSHWDKFIIMIDDFQVPWDDGYGHGSYGTLRSIDMKRLQSAHNLCAFFPGASSKEETSGVTGCVLLAKENDFARSLHEMSSIRMYRE